MLKHSTDTVEEAKNELALKDGWGLQALVLAWALSTEVAETVISQT